MQSCIGLKQAQRGISLVIVLIALLIMSLAAVALVRSVDTGLLITGNLGFKQAATLVSDSSAEAAITWLQTNNSGTTLYSDNTTAGYYSTSLDTLDVSGKSSNAARAVADWNNDNCATISGSYSTCIDAASASTSNGYTTNYLITRLCKTAGDPNLTTNSCIKQSTTSTSTTSPKRGEVKYGEDKRFTGSSGPFYRIVVRTKGPRNTISYTETYIHF
jgi:Tfp pilus assembly protein PilX